MSSPTRWIAPRLMAAYTSPRTRAARRAIAEWRRRSMRRPHQVHYFHQVDDPYSQLAAQLLERLVTHYDVELVAHLVGPPSDAAAPERARLEAFARKDAADIAPGYRLVFPHRETAPDAANVQLATRVLAAAIGGGRFASAAAAVGSALFDGDRASLTRLADLVGAAGDEEARAAVEAGSAERQRRGHYLAAMFWYGGEWYWGVDRLHHLERRLLALGARRAGTHAEAHADSHADSGLALLAPRPDPSRDPAPPARERLLLECFLSLRSPYSYIALGRSFDLARRLPVELLLRPVLPMVMRGLPVPREKQLYIVLDTRREAEDAGVPFGRVCDPVGRPVERCFSLYRWARERGRAGELLLAFTRASFAQGIDTGSDAGMRAVVERAGLRWSEARERLDRDDGWRAELESNREALFALGLWGVPSYCLRDATGAVVFSTWGQDRLWLVEAEIRRRLASE
jgi:2-hydroxychromene-2-carboxylate isomerase